MPEAVGLVISSGITLPDFKAFSGALRLRYFCPRYLTSEEIYFSNPTALLNAEVGYQFDKTRCISADFFNLLNCSDRGVDYSNTSRVTPTAWIPRWNSRNKNVCSPVSLDSPGCMRNLVWPWLICSRFQRRGR